MQDIDKPIWISHSGQWYLYPTYDPREFELEHRTRGTASCVFVDLDGFVHWTSEAVATVPKCVMRGVELFIRGVQ